MAELSRFMQSWGAQNHILYYQRTGRNFLVIPALSCVNILLKEVASRLVEHLPSLSEVPLVRGFLYFSTVYNEVYKLNVLSL